MTRLFPAAILFLAVVALYGVTASFGYLRFDDPDYTFACPFVKDGLTWSGVKEAFANARHGAIWMPVTWLSYMADIAFFGSGAGPHHVVNVLLHACNAVLLLALGWRLAGNGNRQPSTAIDGNRIDGHRQPSTATDSTALDCNRLQSRALPRRAACLLFALVAFWALHPQRVEAVAWIASRKELLWAFFTLGGLLAWQRGRRWAAYLCCALACMSKPTAMVFPLLAWLVDGNRQQSTAVDGNRLDCDRRQSTAIDSTAIASNRIVAYLPLVLLAALTGALAVFSQTHPAGMATKDLFYAGLGERLLNAAVAIGLDLGQMIVPVGLHLDYRAVPGGWPVDGALGLGVLGLVVGGWWLVVSGRWGVISGWWLVVSGRWGVISGWWLVVSDWFCRGGARRPRRAARWSAPTRRDGQGTNYQLPTTNHQLPTTNYQLPTTNHQLPTTNYHTLLWSLAWFLLALLPTLGLFGSFGEHARADRFLYVPAMFLPLGFARWWRQSIAVDRCRMPSNLPPSTAVDSCRLPSIALASAYLLAVVALAVPLILSYRSDAAAFARTLACDPNHGRALAHVGEARCAAAYDPAQTGPARAAALDEGIALLRRSQELRPRDVTAGKLAYALMKRGCAADWQEIRAVCATCANPDRSAGDSQGRGRPPGGPPRPSGPTLAVQTAIPLDLRDTKGQALEALGTAELHDRHWSLAATYLQRAILAPARFYSAEDARLKLAFALHNGGNPAAARRLFETLAQSPRADISARANQSLAILRRSPRAVLFW